MYVRHTHTENPSRPVWHVVNPYCLCVDSLDCGGVWQIGVTAVEAALIPKGWRGDICSDMDISRPRVQDRQVGIRLWFVPRCSRILERANSRALPEIQTI